MWRFSAGVLFSVLGGFCFYWFHTILMIVGIEVDFGGDKSNVFVALFFGMPLGSILGFLLVDRLVYEIQKYNILGIIVGLAASMILGGIGSILFLDAIGGKAIILIPFMIVCISLVGYQAGRRPKAG